MKSKKSSSARKQIQAYAFVDTNIFLDFYRTSNEASLTLLEKLTAVQDRIISTYQVEMEFLKNRQETLLQAFATIKSDISGSLPAVLIDGKNEDSLKNQRNATKKKLDSINKKVASILDKPSQNDRVYQVLCGIFSNQKEHVLTREREDRQKIKRLALRRFLLGYPPRKTKDTSYGDALNWEWIIETSTKIKGKIIIVSRDGDYGSEHAGKYYLNDQLKREFRDRVGKKSIAYTKKLSDALKQLKIPITQEEDEAQSEILETNKAVL